MKQNPLHGTTTMQGNHTQGNGAGDGTITATPFFSEEKRFDPATPRFLMQLWDYEYHPLYARVAHHRLGVASP